MVLVVKQGRHVMAITDLQVNIAKMYRFKFLKDYLRHSILSFPPDMGDKVLIGGREFCIHMKYLELKLAMSLCKIKK